MRVQQSQTHNRLTKYLTQNLSWRRKSEGVSGRVYCSGTDSGIRPWSSRSTSDVRAVMATKVAESRAGRKVSWERKNVEQNPTRRDRPAATVTKRETTCLVPRCQSSVLDLHGYVSACHLSFYQGHLHTPLTEVSLKSRSSCTSMPLVRGCSRSMRDAVFVLLCRSSQGVVDRCGFQNEYPRHYKQKYFTISAALNDKFRKKIEQTGLL